ncbi:MAG: HAMP domain-containing sensor histidine kinase [Bacteroidia bacterium]|nr:HAMP domain-containing sensor histidine kinase [Bacteroidia bacterium]
MKFQTKHIFFLKIIAIVLLSLAGAWVFLKGLVFSAALILIGIISIAVSMYFDRKKLIGRVEQLIAGIRHSDFSTHFASPATNDEFNHLSREMNDALHVFRSRARDAMIDEAESQAWQKLISVLTHEIMNSVAPIISLSETLSERTDTDLQTMNKAMQTIHRRGKGLLSFVENYRKLTKIPQPFIQPIRASALFESLQLLVESDQIRFSFTCYPEKLVFRADRNMIDQILINLLRNAREATENQPNPEIKIRAEQAGNEVHISVIDNGSGISPEAIDKIFIPFYSTKPAGSGIGLSLSRQMMIRHKGRITVKSDENGSTFTVVFPE